jgi:hypothetical protein
LIYLRATGYLRRAGGRPTAGPDCRPPGEYASIHATTEEPIDLGVRRADMAAQVEGAMQTPDGAWRVEVVKRGRSRWYRIINDARDVTFDWLSIAAVERVLAEASIGMADRVPVIPVRDSARTTGAA